jgi:outer membrane receptor protein involved in Fe transport
MKRNFTRVLGQTLLLVQILGSPLWAGTTGKIAGQVIDQKTGTPLPGVNVMVSGTSLGGVTDLNGNYTILEVPPGFYSVHLSMLGYARVTVQSVRVLIDQTAHVEVGLNTEVLQGETVTVAAKREIVKTDVATSVVAVSDREIEELPVANVTDVVGMQAGIQNGMDIRGGAARDALFLMDGVTMRDPRNNQPINRIALSAVKEISIERGGFNAEYGQVQTGLVNVVTKEGAKAGYTGSFLTRVGPPSPKYYREHGIPDVQDADSYWLRPYFDDAVCWTGTTNGAWDQWTRDKYPMFIGWNEISQQLMTDADPSNDLTPLGAQRVFLWETRKRQRNQMADYEVDAGFGGPVPVVSKMLGNLRFFTSYRRDREALLWPVTRPDYLDYDWTMQVNSDITPSMRLRLSGLVGKQFTMEENWTQGRYMRSPNDIAGGTGGSALFYMFSDWAWSLTDIGQKSAAAKLTHSLNKKTFYEVSLEFLQRNYLTRPTALRDTSTQYEVIPGYFVDEAPIGYWPSSLTGIVFGAGEQASLARDHSVVRATTLKGELTSQVNYYNLVKGGVELVYNDLDLDYGVIQMQTQGKTYNSRVQLRNFPVRASGYLQDKMETKGFVLNAGLRLDYSDSRTDWWNSDPYDPFFITAKYNASRTFDMKPSKGQWQLSPRLGISHPITENSKLFFNYGHFKQMPQYETLYRLDRNSQGALTRFGDPNLVLARTISYELGYDHSLFDRFLLQVTAFYRDITDQQNTTLYTSLNNDTYNLSTSNAYQDVRGFELTLRKNAGRWLTGFANYTYQVTSSGTFGQARKYQDPSRQTLYDENTTNLYQQRPMPSPYARADINLHTPGETGPSVLGHSMLGGFMLNMLLYWNEGGWSTYNPKNAKGVQNNIQFVDYLDAQMRVSKTVSFSGLRIQLLADFSNLLNALRLRDTGDQDYRISLHLPRNKGYDNIPGHDKFGDYRQPGVAFQPMEYLAVVDQTRPAASAKVIYYEGTTGRYWQCTDSQWAEVSKSRLDRINEDHSYIDMPGPSTYWFLNPRAVMFGARVSFDLN